MARRVQEEEDISDPESDYDYAASDELWSRIHGILTQEYNDSTDDVKRQCEALALEAKYDNWRYYRSIGRLAENEESLAQKARDDAAGISGRQQVVGGRGRGAGLVNYLPQQGMGTFIGGVLAKTVREEITPPFDKNSLKVKIGKIEGEEYF